MATERDGWVRLADGYWAFFVSGVIRTGLVLQVPSHKWQIAGSDPVLLEADLETAKALAVALYRLEV